jgi:hypothetical protein
MHIHVQTYMLFDKDIAREEEPTCIHMHTHSYMYKHTYMQFDKDIAKEKESKRDLERLRDESEANVQRMRQEVDRYVHMCVCMCVCIYIYTHTRTHKKMGVQGVRKNMPCSTRIHTCMHANRFEDEEQVRDSAYAHNHIHTYIQVQGSGARKA